MIKKIILFKDVRDYQIVFLSVFLFLGIINRDWTLRLNLLLIIFLTCLLTQFFLSSYLNFFQDKNHQSNSEFRTHNSELPSAKVKFGDLYPTFWTQLIHLNLSFISNHKFWQYLDILSWRSALITSLGLCLLLRANEPVTMILAGTLAISSKFIFNLQKKHFFNPANFGIIAAITMTNDAWISPGQWGNDWWYLLLFIGTGLMMVQKVGRWDSTGVFLLTYGGLYSIYNYWLGWDFDVLQHQLMNGSLLVFSFFMLTDPRSIPNAKISRIIWSFFIALLAFILQSQFYLNNAVFWSLFIISPLTILLDQIWQKQRFQWS